MIGKQHLAAAIERFRMTEGAPDVRIRWHSRLLLPGLPSDGTPYEAFYLRRLGSTAAVAARRAQVEHAGRAAGIAFRFDRIEMLPNTIAAHRLAMHPELTDAQRETLIARIFAAHFVDGLFISDMPTLARLAASVGLDAQRMHDYLVSDAGRDTLLHAQATPAYRAVTGVPGLVLNGSVLLSGAQPPDVLLNAMAKAVA